MNRRDLIRQLLLHSTSLAGAVLCSHCYTPSHRNQTSTTGKAKGLVDPRAGAAGRQDDGRDRDLSSELMAEEGIASGDLSSQAAPPEGLPAKSYHQTHNLSQDGSVGDFERFKMRNFDMTHQGDVFIAAGDLKVMESLGNKLERIEKYVGFGRFNLLSFDEAIRQAKVAPGIAAFTKEEISFFEAVFYFDAERYGFHGDKIVKKLNTVITPREVIKIPGSGHYLYRDVSLPIYERIIKDVGNTIILTSGIRGVVKQTHLFLAKAKGAQGNLSQASRSLAPPGYSYHAVGDFDVGKRGLGTLNFTNKFSETPEYRKLIDLGYIDIRYPFDNPFGVRFEPWHILGVARRV